ncbi:MAG TPA: hypothetical protein VH113_08955 [Gemmatimonadales bacterium]|nr:hypothetical protein [Gemmatimonadales bacterium]
MCVVAHTIRESLVIILNAGGSPLDDDALREFDGVSPVWVRVEREGRSSCLAARVRHVESLALLGVRIREWGGARGWTVTVAPCSPLR